MSSFYAGTVVVVENSEGELLLVKQGKDHVRDKWDFPGGGWENRESITECAKREVLEETGYKIEITGFLGIYKELSQEDGTEVIAFIFQAETVERVREGPEDEEEILGAKFFEPEEIEQLDLRVESRVKVLEKYLNQENYEIESLWNQLNLLE